MNEYSFHKMEGVLSRVAEIEKERRRKWRLHRYISLISTIMILLASIVSSVNTHANFVTPNWKLSLVCLVFAFVDSFVEYFIRRRMFMIEGRSVFLLETIKSLEMIAGILNNAPENVDTYHPAFNNEIIKLKEQFSRLEGSLTYDDSCREVVARPY
jgi:hypothetical protein